MNRICQIHKDFNEMINNIETHFSLNNEKSKTNKYEKSDNWITIIEWKMKEIKQREEVEIERDLDFGESENLGQSSNTSRRFKVLARRDNGWKTVTYVKSDQSTVCQFYLFWWVRLAQI